MCVSGDPLLPLDPILRSISEQSARDSLVAIYDHELTQSEWATGYRWNIVLKGASATRTEQEGDDR